MTFGAGGLVADRWELVREIGGGDLGRVWVARDRHLDDREVALRIVAAADPGVLLGEARWMADAHAHSPAAIAVLDIVPTPGGGGYVASELVPGTALEEVARRRAPLPVAEAVGYGVELLDAVISLRRHVPTAGSAVVGSALVGTDGRIRVTRFSRPPASVGRLDGAVVGTAETLRDLLSGSQPPASLATTIDDALTGRIATPEELRGRLLAEVTQEAPTAVGPPPPAPEHRNPWPWIIAAIVVVLAVAIGLGIWLANRDDGTSEQATVPDVVGQVESAAVQAVYDAGFDARVSHVPAPQGRSDGVVLSTDPPGGTVADTGSTVRLQVSQAPGDIVVPTLLGLSRDEAVATLAGAGLRSRVIEQPSSTTPANTVISQEPQGGLKVPEGSTVAVTVAVAATTTASTTVTAPPATVAVPNLVGLTADAASTTLLAAGLQPGKVTQAPAGGGGTPGQITAQDPAAGTQVAPRTKVDVTVATGG